MKKVLKVVLILLFLYILFFQLDFLFIKERKFKDKRYNIEFIYPNDITLSSSGNKKVYTIYFQERSLSRYIERFSSLHTPPDGIAIHIKRSEIFDIELDRAIGNVTGGKEENLLNDNKIKINGFEGRELIGKSVFQDNLEMHNRIIVINRIDDVVYISASWYDGAPRDWEAYFDKIVNTMKF